MSPRAELGGTPTMNIDLYGSRELPGCDAKATCGMPIGVGSGGCTYRFVEESMGSKDSGTGDDEVSKSCDKDKVGCEEEAID